LLTQQLNFHGRFTEFFAQTADLPVTAIKGWLFHCLLAGSEERLAPGRDPGGGEPELPWQQVESFPAQQA
jgi:hypothetical protein